MYIVQHPIRWLKGFVHSRGYGIQSPADYALVRNVICERWPYYQYGVLGRDDKRLVRMLGLLYFRLANWMQPKVIECEGFDRYLHAGCLKAVVTDSAPHPDMMLVRLTGDYVSRVERAIAKAQSHSLLIVEGINRDVVCWKSIVDSPQTGITFDLYYCGLVFFDKKRDKQHYFLNI